MSVQHSDFRKMQFVHLSVYLLLITFKFLKVHTIPVQFQFISVVNNTDAKFPIPSLVQTRNVD